jgi:hypothetical protein
MAAPKACQGNVPHLLAGAVYTGLTTGKVREAGLGGPVAPMATGHHLDVSTGIVVGAKSIPEAGSQRPTAKAGRLVLAMAVAGANGGSTIGRLTAARAAMLSAALWSAGKVNPHWRHRK